MFHYSDQKIESLKEIQVLHGNTHSEALAYIQDVIFSGGYYIKIIVLSIIL